jgi:hypothetical protein
LEEVFEKLDSDNDGEISSSKLDIEPLSARLLEFFKPLFWEMQESEVVMTKEQFVIYSLRLYERLNPTERRALLDENKSYERKQENYEEDYTFAPYISNRSKALAGGKSMEI